MPTRIKALVGKDIERVAGGQNHTIFLRRDGVVYGCGSCKLGQVSGALLHDSAGETQLMQPLLVVTGLLVLAMLCLCIPTW